MRYSNSKYHWMTVTQSSLIGRAPHAPLVKVPPHHKALGTYFLPEFVVNFEEGVVGNLLARLQASRLTL